jgi:hypothetical protein
MEEELPSGGIFSFQVSLDESIKYWAGGKFTKNSLLVTLVAVSPKMI